MNTMRLLVTAVVALCALLFHSSQVGAETSLEIRLILLPTESVNLSRPRWTSCTGSPSASPVTEGAVRTIVTRSEEGEREDRNLRIMPGPAYRPAVNYQEASKPAVDGPSLPTTRATLRNEAVTGSLVLQAISSIDNTRWNRGAEIPLHANSSIALGQPVKLVKSTIAGAEEVLVLPIRIRDPNGLIPHFRKMAATLSVILPSVRPDELEASRIRYTFQSVPLEQSQPLPRATRVLTRARVPGDSVENKHDQRRLLDGAGH